MVTDDQQQQLYVVCCSESEKPITEPMAEFNASLLRDYHDDNQGTDYCIGDHYLEKWPMQPKLPETAT